MTPQRGDRLPANPAYVWVGHWGFDGGWEFAQLLSNGWTPSETALFQAAYLGDEIEARASRIETQKRQELAAIGADYDSRKLLSLCRRFAAQGLVDDGPLGSGYAPGILSWLAWEARRFEE